MTPIYLAIYIGTTNDTNGNPRRGWYVSRIDGEPMIPDAPTDRKGETAPAYTCWVEEGYRGNHALYAAVLGENVDGPERHTFVPRARSLVRETGRIEVTPGEYRSARKLPRFGA